MMDAKKFIIENRRMCNLYCNDCSECPLGNTYCLGNMVDCDIDNVIATVEKWSKEHPFRMVTTDIHFDKLDLVALENTYRYLNSHFKLDRDNETDRKHMSYTISILKHILDLTE